MEIKKEDILTPANVTTIIGGVLAVHGALHIQELSGVLEFGVGRAMDVLDGPIARRTHASRFGALLDASVDKAAISVAVVEAWQHDIVPKSVLGAIAMVNVVNAATNIYSEKKGAEPKTTWAGKRYMFGWNASYGAFALAHALHNNTGLEAVGWASFAVTAPIAAKSSIDYTRQALQAQRNSAHTHIQPKRHQASRR